MKNGKMKRLICLIAVICMMLQSFSIVNAAAADITINATNAANGVSLSWNASDFGGAAEYTLYRDNVPLATVDADTANVTISDGTWTYNDVYFSTLEQMLGELPGKDSADLNTEHTYYVEAGNVTSASVTGKPDATKLIYFTFSGVENTADWTNWSNINTSSKGIQYNKYVAPNMATQNTTASALQTTGDYSTYTSKYSIESLTTKTHRGFSFVGKIDGKMAGGLVAAKTSDTTVPYASSMQFNINSDDDYTYFYADTVNRDYTAWVNASITDNKMITNDSFGNLLSNGEVIPDNESAVITYKYGINNVSFAFDIDDSLTGKDRYATYKFTVNRQFNSSSKYLGFYGASSSDFSKGIGDNTKYYDADGEYAAIHSIALMRSEDCLSGVVEDVVEENLPDLTATVKANGVVLTWQGGEFSNAGEYELYRDGEKIATVNGSSVGEYDTENGTYSYSDVYFNTLEEMLSEDGKSPAVAVNTNHTYYVAANEITSETVTATADTSKVKYFTFNATTEPTNWNNINADASQSGIRYNKSVSNITTGSSMTMASTGDYSAYTTKYTTETGTDKSFIGNIYGKMSGGLVFANNGTTTPTASMLQFNVTDTDFFADTAARDYTVLVNGLFNHDSGCSSSNFGDLYGKFKDDGSNQGYVIPDEEGAEIVFWPSASSGFTVQYDTDLAMEDRYATYVFTTNLILNADASNTTTSSDTKYFNFKAPSVSTDNAAKLNASGENAAVHSIAVIRSEDYLDVPTVIDDTIDYETNLQEAKDALELYRENLTSDIPLDGYSIHGAKVTWTSSNTAAVGHDGKVYPKVGAEQTATLTATLAIEGYAQTATKTFDITVPAVLPYEIDGIKITGEDGITDTQLVSGKKIEKISVRRYAETANPVTAVVALYESGKLVDAKVETVTPSLSQYVYGDLTLKEGLTLPTITANHTAKVFLLENTSNLVPLAESYTVKPLNNSFTVYMAGASTTATYTAESYPQAGWGQMLQEEAFLNQNNATINNTQSMGGRSSKSFIAEGRLEYIKNNIQPGDYIFVQFGNNDAKYLPADGDVALSNNATKTINRHTGIGEYATDMSGNVSNVDKDSSGNYNYSFFAYLQNYVDVAKNAGANIVLFTNFNRAETTTVNMQGYPEAMKAFAAARNIPVIDVTTSSTTMFNKALTEGETKVSANEVDTKTNFALNLFLYVAENDARYISDADFASSKYKSGIKDGTHFNEYGAAARAKLAIMGLSELKHPLSRYSTLSQSTMNDLIADIISNIPTPYYGSASNPALN